MPRVEAIILPLLRAVLPGVTVGTWVEDIDHRKFPLVHVRRIGGVRSERRPLLLGTQNIELAAYRSDDLASTAKMYDIALEALYVAVHDQTVTPDGWLSSIKETIGAVQLASPYQDSWRVQGGIQLGVRPPHSHH
jgi:hypothetical protein